MKHLGKSPTNLFMMKISTYSKTGVFSHVDVHVDLYAYRSQSQTTAM